MTVATLSTGDAALLEGIAFVRCKLINTQSLSVSLIPGGGGEGGEGMEGWGRG